MLNPSPVPPNLRVVEPSACLKASKMCACCVGRNPDAGVLDLEMQHGLPRVGRHGLGERHAQRHATLAGELHRVAEQVQQDLAETVRIGDEVVGHVRRDLAAKLQPFLLRAKPSAFRRSCIQASRSPKARCSNTIWPASIFEKSSTSLITVSSPSAELFTISRYSRCAG